jgi:hypothetical protein
MLGMGAVAILFVWFLLAVGGTVATVWWARRAWKRGSSGRPWVKVMAAIVVAAAVFGAFGTVLGLVSAFGATGGGGVDPSRKARVVAGGISAAMNCTAAAMLVWLPSAVALAFLTRSRESEPR